MHQWTGRTRQKRSQSKASINYLCHFKHFGVCREWIPLTSAPCADTSRRVTSQRRTLDDFMSQSYPVARQQPPQTRVRNEVMNVMSHYVIYKRERLTTRSHERMTFLQSTPIHTCIKLRLYIKAAIKYRRHYLCDQRSHFNW